MASLMVACAPCSDCRSQASTSGKVSPIITLPRSCRLGSVSSVIKRSISASAMFHLANGFFARLLRHSLEAPMLEHAVVDKVLVDGREFVLQMDLKALGDLGVTLHL